MHMTNSISLSLTFEYIWAWQHVQIAIVGDQSVTGASASC